LNSDIPSASAALVALDLKNSTKTDTYTQNNMLRYTITTGQSLSTGIKSVLKNHTVHIPQFVDYYHKITHYCREERAMPLYILIRIKFYNGIARFLCHSMAFL